MSFSILGFGGAPAVLVLYRGHVHVVEDLLETEAAIEAQPLGDATFARAAAIAADEIAPISDVRASAWYRTELTRKLTERLLRDVSRP